MTCIVGIETEKGVLLAGDSLCTKGSEDNIHYSIQSLESKVWKKGPFVIGAAGPIRYCNVVRYLTDFPSPPKSLLKPLTQKYDGIATKFVVTKIVTAIQKSCEINNVSIKEENEETGELLVGFGGRLFDIGFTFAVGRSMLGCSAIGAGAVPALGALHAMSAPIFLGKVMPDIKLKIALSASECFSPLVRGPFNFISE